MKVYNLYVTKVLKQTQTAMFGLYLEQLSPKHNVALMSGKKKLGRQIFLKEIKDTFQKDQ